MEEIRRRYGDTELYWAFDPDKRAAGEEIIRTARARQDELLAGLEGAADLAYQEPYRSLPPPPWTTLTTYEHILDAILDRGLGNLGGDVVEIGVFVGGGTLQLARLWERLAPERRVVAIDIFQPDVDRTEATTGLVMSGIYHAVLGDRDQRTVYDAVTGGLENV